MRKIIQHRRVILVDEAPWLGIGVVITLYVVEDDVERFLSIGVVTNVQYNKLVQIALRTDAESRESDSDIWEALDRTEKGSLLVKPGSYHGGV